ncbi:MAG TPA: Glu-tRNA(Gln) amidotransferase subunit GatE [Candidatus Bathyarchaeota archaeon]|nr:Glu-tRNA(Gln) amidotransferase subunit GatE [Candidatus Bathyarchaeota archaeon]
MERKNLKIDYSQVGLKVGLEIHQQLNTRHKLFCNCKPELFKDEPEITFLRRLRPTQSELGQIDPAAYFEFQKGTKILYEADEKTSCLVEMDEEPPHSLNMEAVEIALTIALMLNAKPVDEIHVMRKTVIDGSNTTGFQRTCIVALNGELDVKGKKIPIQHIAVEEDAARIMGREGSIVRYRIDRLGIPLIEVTTGPVIYSPKEAEEVAFAIGRILRATGKVKRGLGTIRQDLNISIRQGALIEVKGVQELELLPVVIENEVRRQLGLLKIKDELQSRGVREEDIREEFVDVTDIFKETKCKVIKKATEKGKKILAVKLPKFAGLLKFELAPGMRLGKEMADRAKFWGRVGGIFHTDELPAYGITEEEVRRLRLAVKAEESDAVVFVADAEENAIDALKAVVERAREALRGVPEETRAANPDGSTRYMRPRPGAARMYPETDVPPIQINQDYIKELKSKLPELPEQKLERLMKDYLLNRKLASQVLDSEYCELFEEIVKETGVTSTLVAATLTETMKALRRDGIEVWRVPDERLLELFKFVGAGKLAKEAIPDIITWLSKNEDKNVEDAIKSLGLSMLSEEEIRRIVRETVEKNMELVKQRGKGAFGPLMGIIMRNYRGKVDAEKVSKLLREYLESFA